MASPTHTMSPEQTAAAERDSDAVRVVLFGMPNAGKTSLLAALTQATQTQEGSLGAHVTDIPDSLKDIRRQVYEEHARQTLDEIVPYPVKVDPAWGEDFRAVLYDCDGRVANELLTRHRILNHGEKVGKLAQAILDADALILVVDASADAEEIDSNFREFRRFLRLLKAQRTRGRQVGGMPVFLALTKCDRLANPGMTRSEWEARIEEKKQEVARRFRDFLKEDEDGPPYLSFGSIDLEVATTAIRQPELKHIPPQAQEPYGVAELFHECLEAAERFQLRTARGRRRLFWTVAGALSFLLVMAIGAAIFIFSPATNRPPALTAKVESYQAREGATPSTRLSGGAAALQRRLAELTEFQNDPQFEQLPGNLQTFITSRRDELIAYLRYRDELYRMIPPAKAQSLAELEQIRERLTRLEPPEMYRAAWKETEAVRYRDRLLAEVPTLRQAADDLRSFFQRLSTKAVDLLFTSDVQADWARRVQELSAEAESPPFAEADPVRGAAYYLDEVVRARRDWEQARERLGRLRDLATALGLVGNPSAPQAALDLTEPPAGTDINALARQRLEALRRYYPDYETWSPATLPDPVRPQIVGRLQRTFDLAIRNGQRMIAERLRADNPTGPERHTDWLQIADWIMSPSVREWRELATILAKLLNPSAEDPALTLAGFLRKPAFDIELRKLKLRIPDNLRGQRLRPAGPLVVYYRGAADENAPYAPIRFKQVGEPARDPEGAALSYTFQLEEGDGKFRYKPGDIFWADLRLKEGDRDWQLTWARRRSASYQFERLTTEPSLHDPQRDISTGEFAEGVQITVTDGKLPAIPALLPEVTFEKK
jgi:GTPase SAR1 family protein